MKLTPSQSLKFTCALKKYAIVGSIFFNKNKTKSNNVLKIKCIETIPTENIYDIKL